MSTYCISVALSFAEEAVEICSLTLVFIFGMHIYRVSGIAAIDLDDVVVNLTLIPA